ncbi:MAG: hypothetical protein WC455_11650 [Dehalococcoidia bacterium]
MLVKPVAIRQPEFLEGKGTNYAPYACDSPAMSYQNRPHLTKTRPIPTRLACQTMPLTATLTMPEPAPPALPEPSKHTTTQLAMPAITYLD